MGLSHLCLAAVLAISSLEEIKHHSLYLMQQNQVADSIEKYREFSSLAGRHDFEVLQEMGLMLLKRGSQSADLQTFLMTLFGAGLSGSTSALEILEKGLYHADPQIQMHALHFIAKFEDDRTNELLHHAMSSDYLGVRMEAAFAMAQRKHPHAVGQIEGLMVRLPPVFKAYFPSLFALIGTADATTVLRRLIEDPDPQVRVESILHAARMGRDDFLPLLRKRLTHSHVAEVEATAFAVGALKDSSSISKLQKLAQSPTDTIRIAAGLALLQVGDRSGVAEIEEMAKKHNLFAIAALGHISETDETLASLLPSRDLQVRLNAAVALLQHRDARAAPILEEILINDGRNLAFMPFGSLGRTMSAIKAIPSAELRAKDPTIDLSYSLVMREHYLREAANLPEKDFLQLADHIFKKQQNDLVPVLISLLENLQTEGAIALLKEGAEKIASPLIRDYCHLALYRLKTEGPYEEYINNWVMRQKGPTSSSSVPCFHGNTALKRLITPSLPKKPLACSSRPLFPSPQGAMKRASLFCSKPFSAAIPKTGTPLWAC